MKGITEDRIPDYVLNIKNAWELANDVQRFRGRVWYPTAHDLAEILGHGDTRMGAGLLAALSPNKSWNENRRLAVDGSLGIFHGHVQNALSKAQAIMSGVDPAAVLPMSRKTGHFFMNIWQPDNYNYVTVDRHAIRVATWEWDNGEPTVTVKQYGVLVQSYILAAIEIGEHPDVVQAGTWVWARER